MIQIFSIRGSQILGSKVQSGVLRKGDLKAIKSLIGTTTFLPAEGRTS